MCEIHFVLAHDPQIGRWSHGQERQDSFVPLKQSSCQEYKTLEGFYRELAASDDYVSAKVGNRMLRLLPGLSELCKPFEVWGLTSHYDLWLLAEDDWRSPWMVCIQAFSDEYRIRYRIPESDAPWPDAYAEGSVSSELIACERVLIAMRRSGAWR